MINAPKIIMQLIHIEGPLKNDIQEYTESEIYIGRHSSCHVRFPSDFSIVSRKHAVIIREGNRYKVIDDSSNGTYVNGKKISQAFLKDGDILMFAEGGPKVSFLTEVDESQTNDPSPHVSPPQSQPPESKDPHHVKLPQVDSVPKPNSRGIRPRPTPSENLNLQPKPDPSPQRVNAPLIIQHGPTLQSYTDLPIVIGKSPNCDLILNQPSIFDQHAQIFFNQDQYWIKDLTGRACIHINGNPINSQYALTPEDILMLSDQGPSFRFIGSGRLAEVEQPADSRPLEQGSDPANGPDQEKTPKSKKSGSIFKKLFR